jgi:RyR domain
MSSALQDVYRPNPIDTSVVDLTAYHSLIGALTRNAHDVWASLRMREGWSYGPIRDDERRLHPCLVRFEDLTETEQACDGEMTREILKAAIALGFRG